MVYCAVTPAGARVKGSPVCAQACYRRQMMRKARGRRKAATTFEQVPVAIVRRIARCDDDAAATPSNMIVEPTSKKSEPRSVEFWLVRPERRMSRG